MRPAPHRKRSLPTSNASCDIDAQAPPSGRVHCARGDLAIRTAPENPAPPRAPRRRRWRNRFLAVGLAWLALEIALPFAAWRAPLALRAHLPPPLYILGEASKSHFVPRDYVLVLGDSYAAGGGDWLIDAIESGGNPAFQATDVVHASTGRDVLSFGTAGADSVSSTAYMASKRFAQLRRNGLGDPSDVVVYFYEGNDLNDNLRYARRRFGLGERAPDSFGDDELDALIAARGRAGFRAGLAGMFYAPYVLHDLFESHSGGGESVEIRVRPCADENRVAVGSSCHAFIEPAQSPAMELEEEELSLALRMFERSLAWVKQRFAGAGLTLVYLPSPLACYDILSPDVRVQSYEGRRDVYSAAAVYQRSDWLRERVGAAALAQGFAFVDTTPALRKATRERLVHGPIECQHFNRAGHEVVGDELARALRARRAAE